MRSGILAGLVLLAGCQDKYGDPYAPQSGKVETTSQPGSTDAPPPPPPLPPGAPEPAPATSRFLALGTEPFWSVEVGNGRLRYATPENQPGTSFPATEGPLGKGQRFAGIMHGQQVILVIAPGTCSDGMSDTVYAYSATLTIGARTERGCARTR